MSSRTLRMTTFDVPTFLREEFDFDTLLQATESDLVAMDVKIGSRRKILGALAKYNSVAQDILNMKSWEIKYSELQLVREAGQGFYGTVFKGLWNNADVAIKKIFPSKVQSLEKWLLEVEFLSTLRHPNIVVFYGACTTPPNLCIVTEWVARGSMHAVLSDEANRICCIDTVRMLSFATDVARGLAFLHSHDPPIIHRDLKSENLLVTNTWRIKLTDFGLSRFKDPKYTYASPSNPFDVTISAPEVLESNHLSEKADVYSFGLILWELLTRKKPFDTRNPHWVAKSVLESGLRPGVPATCPPHYGQLMQTSWHQDYKARPTSKELVTTLELLIAQERLKPAATVGSSYQKSLDEADEEFCTCGSSSRHAAHFHAMLRDENSPPSPSPLAQPPLAPMSSQPRRLDSNSYVLDTGE